MMMAIAMLAVLIILTMVLMVVMMLMLMMMMHALDAGSYRGSDRDADEDVGQNEDVEMSTRFANGHGLTKTSVLPPFQVQP